MKRAELLLRKELALTRLRIVRTEMALARAQKNDKTAAVSSALEVASSVLATKRLGKWGRYARIALTVAQAVLGVSRAV